MKLIFTLVLLCFFLFTNAQSSSHKRLLSSTGNSLFRGIVIRSSDDGYLTAGDVSLYEQGVQNNFVCVIKRNSNGKYLWRYRFDVPYSYTGFNPSMLLETPDHGFLLGIIEDNYNDYGSWQGYQYIIKLDAGGKIKWSQKIAIGDKPFLGAYNPVFGIVTKDSNYIVTACRTFEENFHGVNEQRVLYALKINDNGEVIWLREYFKEGSYLQPTGIIENNDETFTIGLQGGLFNISKNGSFLSGKRFPFTFSTITGNDSSGIYLTGENNILALNKLQEPLWAKRLLNNEFSYDQSAYLWYKSGVSLPGTGCLLVAEIQSSAGGTSLTRFDKNGNTLFQKRLPVTTYAGQSSLVKTNNGYMFYTADWSIDDVIEFDNPGKICNTQQDDVSIVKDETPFMSFEELLLETDSVGSLVTHPFVQTAEPLSTALDKLCTSVLPLNILSFTAYRNGNSNMLKWSTADEINTDHFEVQRSSNGADFLKIGTVKTLNNYGNKNDYVFTDLAPFKSANYYRLRMFDKNGSSAYSAIKRVVNNAAYDVSLYPNPVKQDIFLSFNSQKLLHASIDIYNNEGRLVATDNIDLIPGISIKRINTSRLVNGNYFLSIKTLDGNTSLKFVKG